MSDHKIMYVCDPCSDNAPESCGHYDRDALRVLPDGKWLCEDCLAHGDDLGFSCDENAGLDWHSLPQPPEYVSSVNIPPSQSEPKT